MKKSNFKLIIASLLLSCNLFAQITLSHNVGNTVIPNSMYSCSYGGICWSRKFILPDFGITPNQSYTITQGDVGLFYGINWDTNLQFNIYAIDSGFPATFSESGLLGSSQIIEIPMNININQIITFNFTNPVVVPAGTTMILVEVVQLHSLSSEAHAFVAGTAEDDDFSWFRSISSCPPYLFHKTTVDLLHPDAKFYITVSGNASALSLAQNPITTATFSYPNPVKNELNFTTKEKVTQVEAYDASGRLVATFKVENNKADVAALQTGNYNLKIYTEKGVSNTKIIKE
jgi:hypothetical protein